MDFLFLWLVGPNWLKPTALQHWQGWITGEGRIGLRELAQDKNASPEIRDYAGVPAPGA